MPEPSDLPTSIPATPAETVPAPAAVDTDATIPLAAVKKVVVPKRRVERLEPVLTPEVAAWVMPEEPAGRRFLAVVVLLVVIGLYAWMLGIYDAGAHPGVDQAGYLMTARLISGDFNPDNPTSVARVPVASDKVPQHSTEGSAAVWPGGATGYTPLHPAPAAIQENAHADWLRNRLSFVPESPFQFSSLMNVMTEPYGPASPDSPAEYRYYAKYPFGYPLMAAVGREVAGVGDKKTIKLATPVQKIAATQGDAKVDIERANLETATTTPTVVPSGTAPASAESSATTATTASAPATTSAASVKKTTSTVTTFDRVGRGFAGMYVITPLCTVMACFFAYFLFRQAVSSFTALIGVLWLATNPIVLAFSQDADSHAPTLMCVCLGFWGIVSFLRTQQTWRGWIGALALGYASTIRYSEFILIVPVAFAALVNLRFTKKRLISSLSLLAAWAIPVGVLALVCWISFGSPTKTGYWYCNEETGFGWKYVTGAWPDRQMTANWETVVDQFNRSGLFAIWPLALAGLFGMIGTTWRLGGLIAAWVLPTLVVYLSYYWAPALGDQIAIYYLRFFVSIIPGLIFAALWMLERSMQWVHTGKGAAMTIASLAPLAVLLLLAFYADGGPQVIDGGLGKMVKGMIWQTPAALGHLFSGSSLGFWSGIFLLALVPAMWLFDRDVIASRLGLALGAGVITALGCAVNLQTVKPMMDGSFAQQTMARANVENLREVLPRGTAIFSDNPMLQQLDCVGGWKLYDASAFYLSTYYTAMAQLAKRTNPDHAEEPYPMQDQRWQFYKELLTKPDVPTATAAATRSTPAVPAAGAGRPLTQVEVMELERAVIEKNVAEGNLVTYVELTDAGDAANVGGLGGATSLGGNMRTFRLPSGYEKRMLRKWTLSAVPENVAANVVGVFGAARVRAAMPAATSSAPATTAASGGEKGMAREGPTFVLWEIVKR